MSLTLVSSNSVPPAKTEAKPEFSEPLEPRSSAEWTARELLVYMLAQIDANEAAYSRLVVIGRAERHDPDGTRVGLDTFVAGVGSDLALGMIERAKHQLLEATG